jgi:hypothetical protein|tara:strand:- start:2291 stop:2539 length:249 start_codon:yes stop_codon:yes gene_type:complete
MLNRYYLIINSDETNKIDFNQVRETSVDTLRYSLDGSQTFFKWDYETPTFIETLEFKEGQYSHDEFINILSTNIWTDPNSAK